MEYNLTIAEKDVNFTGKSRTALAVNDSIPAPTLTFHEGDLARMHVTNAMKEDVSIHWHGMLIPNRMDGVPFVTRKPASRRAIAKRFLANDSSICREHQIAGRHSRRLSASGR